MSFLVLFTGSYPFGHGETFLESEIPVLSKYFSITIVPYHAEGGKRKLPSNVEVDTTLANLKKANKLSKFFYHYPFLFVKYNRLLKDEFRHMPPNIVALRMAFGYLSTLKLYKKWFMKWKNKKGISKQKIIFYSYWLTYLALGINYLKGLTDDLDIITISRAHRFDLYEERIDNKAKYIPFREKILGEIDRVFLISEHGLRYLKNKYPQYSRKYILSRLGVKAQKILSQRSNDGIFRIVSCSNLIEVKRIHLIIKALNLLKGENDMKIHWIHIGDGPLREELEIMAKNMLGGNVTYKFIGRLKNEEVLDFYRTNPVDLFINVSSSEGLPVSIMEALSFGIPVLATDVGGSGEIVDDMVGKLLPEDVNPREIAAVIKELVFENDQKRSTRRKKAIEMWNNKVNANINYNNFANYLLKLVDDPQIMQVEIEK